MRRLFVACALLTGVAFADNPSVDSVAKFGAHVANYPVSKIKGCLLSCGATATVIACTTPGFTVRSRTITNTSDTDIYISAADVTTSAGYLLKVGSSITLQPDTVGGATPVMDCAVTGGGKSLSVLEAG